MADHELAERLAGLASRVDELGHLTVGEDSRTVEDQEDRLVKLALVAIAREMDATNKKYQRAVKRVREASGAIGEADEQIENVAENHQARGQGAGRRRRVAQEGRRGLRTALDRGAPGTLVVLRPRPPDGGGFLTTGAVS
jgi:hypothetical protein